MLPSSLEAFPLFWIAFIFVTNLERRVVPDCSIWLLRRALRWQWRGHRLGRRKEPQLKGGPKGLPSFQSTKREASGGRTCQRWQLGCSSSGRSLTAPNGARRAAAAQSTSRKQGLRPRRRCQRRACPVHPASPAGLRAPGHCGHRRAPARCSELAAGPAQRQGQSRDPPGDAGLRAPRPQSRPRPARARTPAPRARAPGPAGKATAREATGSRATGAFCILAERPVIPSKGM